MEGFRERLNKNDWDRQNGGRNNRGGRKDWDEEGRQRDGGRDRDGRDRDSGYGNRGGDDRNGGRNDWRDRDNGRTPSFRPQDTPSSSDPTTSRVKNQSWDSTPSGSATPSSSRYNNNGGRDGGVQSTPKPRNSWDSTPRSVRGTPAPSSSRSSGEWDTPRRVPSGYGDESPGPMTLAPPTSNLDSKEWEAEQTKLDREWYNIDEMGGTEGNDGEFGGYDDYDTEKEAELVNRATGGGAKKRVTAKQAAFNAENEVWEENRLALSGVTGQRRKLDFDALEDDEETRVHLLVHDLKPPFLDGRLAFTKQLEPINPIKDVTSDLAVFAKKGSLLVQERRAQKEREKVRRFRFAVSEFDDVN